MVLRDDPVSAHRRVQVSRPILKGFAEPSSETSTPSDLLLFKMLGVGHALEKGNHTEDCLIGTCDKDRVEEPVQCSSPLRIVALSYSRIKCQDLSITTSSQGDIQVCIGCVK